MISATSDKTGAVNDYLYQSPQGYPAKPPPSYKNQTIVEAGLVARTFLLKVYGWMTLALVITGVIGFALRGKVPTNWLLPIFIVQIVLVIAISWGMRRIQAGTATALFVLYAMTMGVTMSAIFAYYPTESIFAAFFASAAMFAVTAFVGWICKADLTKFGWIMFMGLIGIVIASIIGIFVVSDILSIIIIYGGLLVFLGLTVYENWLIKKSAARIAEGGAALERKYSIVFALSLYLNFINIFIRVLAILNR